MIRRVSGKPLQVTNSPGLGGLGATGRLVLRPPPGGLVGWIVVVWP